MHRLNIAVTQRPGKFCLIAQFPGRQPHITWCIGQRQHMPPLLPGFIKFQFQLLPRNPCQLLGTYRLWEYIRLHMAAINSFCLRRKSKG